jgi:hypothetical protein
MLAAYKTPPFSNNSGGMRLVQIIFMIKNMLFAGAAKHARAAPSGILEMRFQQPQVGSDFT